MSGPPPLEFWLRALPFSRREQRERGPGRSHRRPPGGGRNRRRRCSGWRRRSALPPQGSGERSKLRPAVTPFARAAALHAGTFGGGGGGTMASDFYLRYYVGHKGKFGHEFLEFEFRPDGEG